MPKIINGEGNSTMIKFKDYTELYNKRQLSGDVIKQLWEILITE